MQDPSAGCCVAMNRRNLIAGGGASAAALAGSPEARAQRPRGKVALVANAGDRIASAPPTQWAAGQLQSALTAAGYAVSRRARALDADADEFCVLIEGAPGPVESLTLAPTSVAGRPALAAGGADPRGLSYALTELADRIRAQPQTALHLDHEIRERPANPVRGVMRQFTSELYDKPWFDDRASWSAYLDGLASHRFNRVHLAFGQAYDNLRRVRDSYFLFAYPFLVSVPGYDVRATNLSDEERERNLATLKFITDEAAARGLDFELGFWMHGYQFGPQSTAKHQIEGLTAQNHAAYCRDALTAVLQACPGISAVSLRTHGESGVPEGSYDFWATVFDGVKRCGRKVEIDLHAKGLDSRMLERALATGLPVNVAPKFSAEHMAMPYQEASIREVEMPAANQTGAGLMTLSEGQRVATRSSYADFLREDRKYTVRFRVYPGTQRLLLWGDPDSAGAYARAFTFCGSTGGDVMEPLMYRGRRGTAVPGTRRTGYVDARLEPRWDWQKYAYWYRVWGRKLYNPETPPEVFERGFGFSERDRALAASLASASRILPIVTTAHLPSVACSNYWPEVYWNQPMAAEPQPNPYADSLAPKTFTHASTLDPELFSNCDEFAGELLTAQRSGKYSPLEVAVWLEEFARRAEGDLRRAGKAASVEGLRTQIDIEMQVCLGRFFAAKLRSGVLYALFERTGDRRALEEAAGRYRAARAAWAEVVDRARGVYADDLSVSDLLSEQGSWKDRLPLIDADIAQLEQGLSPAKLSNDPGVAAAVAAALAPPKRASLSASHTPPQLFAPGRPLPLVLAVGSGRQPSSVTLRYRQVNQAERYRYLTMQGEGGIYRASIPADYAEGTYPLQYDFEVRIGAQEAVLFPGFDADLLSRPYFVVRPS